MFSVDDWADMDYAMQEQQWADWERNVAEYPDLAHLFHKPSERLTPEQHKARMQNRALSAMHFRIPDASYKSFKRRT